ncbi:hypothetical protein Ga0061061_104257 [Chelatococcus sambhunathii]|uniref:Uncharacterized protein n=1 Tax=Chelatococcus sambhunathii TaxID=363953 RepID=A0ABM9U4M0_9HYPH|nr:MULTISPECIES: hypothetical protein [Chelatococcus]CUA88170.1 hypothetical protein Ga0061061_104257 [Chelatococcus sambhunathii]
MPSIAAGMAGLVQRKAGLSDLRPFQETQRACAVLLPSTPYARLGLNARERGHDA